MATATTIVTGATGFAGSHLLDRLTEHDAGLVAWYRPDGQQPRPRAGVEWRAVDLADRDGVLRAVEEAGASRVYHLGGLPHVGSSWTNVVPQLRANAFGTHHVLDAVRVAGRPCRVLVVTSAQIYQPVDEPIDESARLRPSNPYGLSKLAADELARRVAADEGVDVVVARPFNHAGPRQSADFVVSSFARQIALIEAGRVEGAIHVGNLDARRDITDVRDVVEAYEELMARGASGRAYNICSGRAWRMRDVLEELVQQSSTRVELVIDPARLRPSDIPVLQGDATRIRSEIGWTPHIPVEQTLHDTLDWWRAELA